MFGQHWSPPFGIGFAIALILALWAVFHIVQSGRAPLAKAIWCVVVLLIPYLGFLAWLLFGPRSPRPLLK
jgi:hypothetical protein